MDMAYVKWHRDRMRGLVYLSNRDVYDLEFDLLEFDRATGTYSLPAGLWAEKHDGLIYVYRGDPEGRWDDHVASLRGVAELNGFIKALRLIGKEALHE